jgi:iron(III) transport system substrate-binding protein
MVLFPAGCDRPNPGTGKEVVLYSSVDDYLLREIIPVFEKESGIGVKFVGDTEATKTTGLVERLVAEREHPRADVWWSNEPFGTIRLAELGLLEPYGLQERVGSDRPAQFRDPQLRWYGLALRARALAFNTKRIKAEEAPASLAALTTPAWKGRIGMARPQFGTTRGQMGAQLVALGPEGFRAWLRGLKENGLRLYDGNSTVVKAIANGEVDVGLTDTDDIYAAQKQGWPVARAPFGAGADAPLLIPNTVGRIKGGPHPAEAAALIEFILSERVERLLAESESRNTPIRPGLAAKFPDLQLPRDSVPDLDAIFKAIPEALKIWDDVFGP